MEHSSISDSPQQSRIFCKEGRQLLNVFEEAVQEMLMLHEQQYLAIIDGDPDCSRFDRLIQMANEKKQMAKSAYLSHMELHGCSNL